MCFLLINTSSYCQKTKLYINSNSGIYSPKVGTKLFHQTYTFASILEKAKQNKKMIIIEFRATWCAPCVKMEKTSFRNSKLKRYIKNNFYTYGVDVDEYIDLDLVSRFNIDSCPTFVFLNHKGKVIKKSYGFKSADKLYKELVEISGKTAEKNKWWKFW